MGYMFGENKMNLDIIENVKDIKNVDHMTIENH